MSNANTIIDFYNNYDEENRLVKDNFHRIEYITNLHYIKKYCHKNTDVLDACAGTGRYAFYLAQNGCKVTAGDIVPANIEIIKSKNKNNMLNDVKINDVRKMDFQDNCFDVVLCMGALYHLEKIGEREEALHECIRILKPNGIIIVSYINKYAQMLINIKNGTHSFEESYNKYKNGKEGIFIGLTPKEIKKSLEKENIETIKNISSNGSAYLLSEQINRATEREFKIWMNYHLETCEDENILGSSLHGLYIGKQKV